MKNCFALAERSRSEYVISKRKRELIIFLELNLIALAICQPAAIMFANWDPPYTVSDNLMAWMVGYLGFWPLFALYLNYKKEYFGKDIVRNYVIVMVLISYLSSISWVMLTNGNVLTLLVGPLGLFLVSPIFAAIYIVILPLSLLYVGRIYFNSNYNGQELGIVNLVIIFMILVIYLLFLVSSNRSHKTWGK